MNHKKIYFKYFGMYPGAFVACENCGALAVDIHHIECRGMGGKNKEADKIENLMALCRNCHTEYGDKKQFKEMLQGKHNERLANWNNINRSSLH